MDIPKGNIKADLIYKNTPQRDLMLTFLPPTQKKYEKSPVYFIISGGGWHMIKRQDIIDFSIQSVEALRNEGFAVVSIDYRVCGEGVVMSEIIADCFDAAHYIAHFADVFEIDRENFFLSGHSAGAHLALMIAYDTENHFKSNYEYDDEFCIKAVTAMSPPTILYDAGTHNLRDIGDVFVGCDTKIEKERTSPVTYVSCNCPPTLLCAGTSDYLVFASSSEKLYEKLNSCNVPCKLKLSVGGGHCFEKVHDSVDVSVGMKEMQKEITDFILVCIKHLNKEPTPHDRQHGLHPN